MKIISPKTEKEFQQYYHLRWRILRKPWGEIEGSERDDKEDQCYHIMAINNGLITGIARLEFSTNNYAQLRYMAVDDSYQGQGIGRKIIQHMEEYATAHNTPQLLLNARENAVGFYEKLGFEIIEKSYLLFDSIQHYKMIKKI